MWPPMCGVAVPRRVHRGPTPAALETPSVCEAKGAWRPFGRQERGEYPPTEPSLVQMAPGLLPAAYGRHRP